MYSKVNGRVVSKIQYLQRLSSSVKRLIFMSNTCDEHTSLHKWLLESHCNPSARRLSHWYLSCVERRSVNPEKERRKRTTTATAQLFAGRFHLFIIESSNHGSIGCRYSLYRRRRHGGIGRRSNARLVHGLFGVKKKVRSEDFSFCRVGCMSEDLSGRGGKSSFRRPWKDFLNPHF